MAELKGGMTLAERVTRLEKLLLPETMKASKSGANWIKAPHGLSIKRCWPDEPERVVNLMDEHMCEIALEPPMGNRLGKPRLVARMNRSITLYAEYIPIYKDVIAMLEKVAAELAEQE
jgi:hypothetical protein